jgi:hypothetical protein
MKYTTHITSMLTLCMLSAGTGYAQDMGAPPDAPMQKPFEINLGLGVMNRPAYLGSDDRKTAALPLLAARWSNGWRIQV